MGFGSLSRLGPSRSSIPTIPVSGTGTGTGTGTSGQADRVQNWLINDTIHDLCSICIMYKLKMLG